MSTSAETIIEQNWETVKNEMRKTWRNLTPTQISKINNYAGLVNQLKKAYDITDDNQIKEKIEKFIDKFDLEPNLTHLEAFKNSLYKKAEVTQDKIEAALKNSMEGIREKAEDYSNYAINYTKENPLKILGLGILTAVAIKKMLEK